MLNDIKVIFYEDDKFEHQIGELKLVSANFAMLSSVINSMQAYHHSLGSPCHFKISAQSLDY